MKPYGFKKWQWREEDGGPTSKHVNLSSKKRATSRRLLHKSARNEAKREINKSELTSE